MARGEVVPVGDPRHMRGPWMLQALTLLGIVFMLIAWRGGSVVAPLGVVAFGLMMVRGFQVMWIVKRRGW